MDALSSIQLTIMGGASLSFLGSFFMMLHILYKFPNLREASTSQHQLFLFALTSCIGSPFMFLNRNLVSDPTLCQIQGYTLQLTVLALPILCFFISLNLYLMMTNQAIALRQGNTVLYLTIAFGTVIPFILATYTLFEKAYGSALIWCWIPISRNDLRMTMFYIPVWFTIGLGLILNLLAVRHVYKIEKEIKKKDYEYTRNVSKVLLYGLSFVICWGPATVNRINEIIHRKSPQWLVIAHCLGTSSLGFCIAIVYFALHFSKPKGCKQSRKPQAPSSSAYSVNHSSRSLNYSRPALTYPPRSTSSQYSKYSRGTV